MSGNTGKGFGILKIAAIVVILIVVVIAALPFILDIDQFRPKLETKLSDALGRKVQMGQLKLSILGGNLGIENIAIADNPHFSRSSFVTAKSLKASVELKPLIFSKEVHITGISLDRPVINLVHSASGEWNFSDLGNKSRAKGEKPAEGAPDLSATKALVEELKIVAGQVTITEEGKTPSVYSDVNITVRNLSFTSAFPFAISASLPGGGKFTLEGDAGPLSKTDLVTTPMKASVSVNHFDLVASGFADPNAGLAGLLDFGGTASSDGRQVISEGHANAQKLQVVKGGSPSGEPIKLDYRLRYDLAQKTGSLDDVKVQIGRAVAILNGNYGIQGDDLSLRMRLNGKDMPVQDLTALLPAFGVTLPKGASLQGGALNVNLTAEGPINRLVTSGTADISNTRLVGYDLAGKMAVLARLAGLKSNEETEIERFGSEMKLEPDGTYISNLLLIMPALGQLSGAGKIAPDQTLDFHMLAKLKPAAGVGSMVARLAGESGLSLPFFVRGTASDPKFVPDTKNAARSILGSALSGKGSNEGQSREGALGDTLRGLFKKKQ